MTDSELYRDLNPEYDEWKRQYRERVISQKEFIRSQHPDIGQLWSTEELEAEFDLGNALFSYDIIHRVVRREDGVRGSMRFTASPRVYYGFVPEVRNG